MADFNFDKYWEDYFKDYYAREKERQQYQAQNNPGQYKSAYSGIINDYRGRIQNRKPFSYDPFSDPVYQQSKKAAEENGRLAMQNTMAQASALTGGYSNSWASSAAQQSFNGYMRDLNEMIPELSDAAYRRYAQEGQDLYYILAMYENADQDDYNKHRDAVADYQTMLSYLTNRADTAYSQGSDRYKTDFSNAFNEYQARQAAEEAAAKLAWDKEKYNRDEAFQREQYEYQKQQDAAQMAYNYAKMYNNVGGNVKVASGKTAGGNGQSKSITKQVADELTTRYAKLAAKGAVTREDIFSLIDEYERAGYDTDELFELFKDKLEKTKGSSGGSNRGGGVNRNQAK